MKDTDLFILKSYHSGDHKGIVCFVFENTTLNKTGIQLHFTLPLISSASDFF